MCPSVLSPTPTVPILSDSMPGTLILAEREEKQPQAEILNKAISYVYQDQNLSLNPTKISGLCGRLMCCLKFEHDNYESSKLDLPTVGAKVMTSIGSGVVVSINPNARTVAVKLQEQKNGKITDFPLDDVVEQNE
jgi:cell fate regulator YaaT (PSP1 superfamily)